MRTRSRYYRASVSTKAAIVPMPGGSQNRVILEVPPPLMGFATVPEALEELRAGRMIVVTDDEDRENEGDLTIAAEFATPEAINFMARHGRGLICLSLTPERCDELGLPLMSPVNTSRFSTAFCEAIDAAEGVSTGISAADRARTIQVAIDPRSGPRDLARPGHMFPLRAREGGVLVRPGQTEAAVDLARLAGLQPAGVICEIMNEDGTMARMPHLEEFCAQHGLKMVSVAQLIRYRLETEQLVRRAAEGCVETEFGAFRTVTYETTADAERHMALVCGDVAGQSGVLVRMHTHCVLGDVFGSTRCQCGELIRKSLERIAREGAGALVYLHQTGPGACRYSPEGTARPPHEVGIGAQILRDLGLTTVRLLTNRPRRVHSLDGYGVEIVEQIPL